MNISLSEEFINEMRQKEPQWGPLGWVVYKRTYARWLPEENRKEEWWETVKRVVEGNINLDPRIQNGTATQVDIDILTAEAQELFRLMYKLVLTPPGRGLWMSGTEFSKRTGDALNNCWFITVSPKPYGDSNIVPSYVEDDPHKALVSMPFSFLFDQSMKGGGVGFNVQRDIVKKIPKVKHKVDLKIVCKEDHPDYEVLKEKGAKPYVQTSSSDKRHMWVVLEDSREGWVKSLAWVIDAHFEDLVSGTLFIDVSNIRGKGERIKGFGGIASGPAPLIDLLKDVNDLLNENHGTQITPVKATDIMNMIGRTVVAGNVRRTAEIALGDPEDKDFITMKQDKDKLYSHRWASNNSIVIDDKFNDFESIVPMIADNGEPGIGNIFLARNYGRMMDGFKEGIDGGVQGWNPCFTGDMRLLTTEGYKSFEEMAGSEVTIINALGEESVGKVWKTGDKETVRLSFLNRDDITCTPDHVFKTTDGEEVKAGDSKGKQLLPFLKEPELITKYIKLGFIQGDGNLGRLDSNTHKGLEVNLGTDDYDVKVLFDVPELQDRKFYTTEYTETLKELGFDSKVLPERELPQTITEWTTPKKRAFLRGLYSANGSVIGKRGRIALKATSSKLIVGVKELLGQLGYSPYITENEPHVVEFPNGSYLVKKSYDLNINNYPDKQKFFNEIGFVQEYKVDKLREALLKYAPTVVGIHENGIKPVYDFTEPKTHWGIVEGVVAHNCGEITAEDGEPCNLVEVFPYLVEKEGENYEFVLDLATRYAKRVTFSKYDWEISREAIQRNRRIGISLSGLQDWLLEKFGTPVMGWVEKDGIKKPTYKRGVVETLDYLYKLVVESDREYSETLGCNESIKLTTVKPSGTVALLPGLSAGVHWNYAPYYIRRIRFQHDDPLLELLEKGGYHIEEDKYSQNTVVVEFPVKASTAEEEYFKAASDVSIEEQFAFQSLMQYAWADNSVSCTITFADAEEHKIAPLMKHYQSEIKSTSLLPYENHGYEQAPYEPISKVRYEEMMSGISAKPHELAVGMQDADVALEGLDGCAGGACPIK